MHACSRSVYPDQVPPNENDILTLQLPSYNEQAVLPTSMHAFNIPLATFNTPIVEHHLPCIEFFAPYTSRDSTGLIVAASKLATRSVSPRINVPTFTECETEMQPARDLFNALRHRRLARQWCESLQRWVVVIRVRRRREEQWNRVRDILVDDDFFLSASSMVRIDPVLHVVLVHRVPVGFLMSRFATSRTLFLKDLGLGLCDPFLQPLPLAVVLPDAEFEPIGAPTGPDAPV